MADKRINALANTASSTASDDFIAVDGTTNGTRKLNAFSPTFGGNATVTGTLAVSGIGESSFGGILRVAGGACVISGSSAPASGSGVELQHAGTTGRILVYNRTAGSAQDLTINHAGGNVTIGGTGTVTSILGTTASTSTSSGALVVGNGTSGGLGVGGAIYAGGAINSDSNVIAARATIGRGDVGSPGAIGLVSLLDVSGGIGRLQVYNFTTSTVGALNIQSNGGALGIGSTSTVTTINGTTASTSTSTGALVVSGGLGVGGSINAGDNISSVNPQGKIQIQGTGNTTGVKEINLLRSDGGDACTFGLTGSAYAGVLTGLGNSEAFIYNAGSFRVFIGTAATNRFDFTSSQFKINPTTASTSTSSGALVVSGGVGVAGKVTSTALGLANTSQSAAAWGDVGVQLSVAGAVLTDTSSSGTVGRIVTNSIAASALAASSTTTYTAAASLFIAGAPTANTNVTITNAYALYTAGGRINFQGLPTSSAGLQAGTLWNDAGTLKVA